MRNMSFFKTTDQIRSGTKTVTRRLGWKFLKPGDRVMAVVKCQGLKKGEKIEKIRPLLIIGVKREPLYKIDDADVLREGFLDHIPNKSRYLFIDMFCELNKCTPETIITRIEFDYCNLTIRRKSYEKI